MDIFLFHNFKTLKSRKHNKKSSNFNKTNILHKKTFHQIVKNPFFSFEKNIHAEFVNT